MTPSNVSVPSGEDGGLAGHDERKARRQVEALGDRNGRAISRGRGVVQHEAASVELNFALGVGARQPPRIYLKGPQLDRLGVWVEADT